MNHDIIEHTICEFLPISSSWFFQKKSFETLLWYHFCVGVGVFFAFNAHIFYNESYLFSFYQNLIWRYFWMNIPMLILGSIILSKKRDEPAKKQPATKNIYTFSTLLFVLGLITYFYGYTYDFLKTPAHYNDIPFLLSYGVVQSCASHITGFSRLGTTTVFLIILGSSLPQAFLDSFLYAIPVLLIPTMLMSCLKFKKMKQSLSAIGLMPIFFATSLSCIIYALCLKFSTTMPMFLFVISIVYRCFYCLKK